MLEPDVVTPDAHTPSGALRCRNVQYLEGSWSARHAGNAFVEFVAVSPDDAGGRPFRGAGNGAGQSFTPRDGSTAALASDAVCRRDADVGEFKNIICTVIFHANPAHNLTEFDSK